MFRSWLPSSWKIASTLKRLVRRPGADAGLPDEEQPGAEGPAADVSDGQRAAGRTSARRWNLPRPEILAVAGVALLAFVITLSVLVSSMAARSRGATAQALKESLRAATKPALTEEELALGVEDFMLPPQQAPVAPAQYAPFRPRLQRWTADQAARYWVAPRDIALEIVQSMNDRSIQRLFQDVP